MPLEDAQFLNELSPAEPRDSDLVESGDDHLRLIKEVLTNTFPNLNEVVSATPDQLNALTEAGFTPDDALLLKSLSDTLVDEDQLVVLSDTLTKHSDGILEDAISDNLAALQATQAELNTLVEDVLALKTVAENLTIGAVSLHATGQELRGYGATRTGGIPEGAPANLIDPLSSHVTYDQPVQLIGSATLSCAYRTPAGGGAGVAWENFPLVKGFLIARRIDSGETYTLATFDNDSILTEITTSIQKPVPAGTYELYFRASWFANSNGTTDFVPYALKYNVLSTPS